MSSEPLPEFPARDLAAPIEQPPRRPRLSIAHLMLWTLGTAIVLAFSRAQFAGFESATSGDSVSTYLRVSAIVTAPFTGIAMAFVIASLWRIYWRQPLPISQPGHWILFIVGIVFLLQAGEQIVDKALFSYLAEDPDMTALLFLSSLSQAFIYGVTAGLSFWAWRRTREAPSWRFFFAATAAANGLTALSPIVLLVSMIIKQAGMPLTIAFGIIFVPVSIAWLISFPWAVGRDLFCRERRDALHWAGAILILVLLLSAVTSMVFLVL